MAVRPIRKNNIIYIIPGDETFQRRQNDAALPNGWNEHSVSFCHREKEVPSTKKGKADAVRQQKRMSAAAAVKPKIGAKTAQKEADAEKRKALYHWPGMRNRFKKSRETGEIDADAFLAQLAEPAMPARINAS